MEKVICPVCGGEIEVPEGAKEGDIIYCSNSCEWESTPIICGTKLKLAKVNNKWEVEKI